MRLMMARGDIARFDKVCRLCAPVPRNTVSRSRLAATRWDGFEALGFRVAQAAEGERLVDEIDRQIRGD